MGYDNWLATNRSAERWEEGYEMALEWAEDEGFEYGDDDELMHAYADYCDYLYERDIDRQIDEARERLAA